MQNAWYSLLVDETTTDQNLKQFDMHVRYWSRSDDKIVRKYLSSAFLGHARADDLLKSITEILSRDGLPIVKMIHLGCDGPDVNKSLKSKLDGCIVKLGGKLLIEIGSCNLHVMHNGFRAGLQSVDHSGDGELKTSRQMCSPSSRSIHHKVKTSVQFSSHWMWRRRHLSDL